MGKQGNGLGSQSHWVSWVGFKYLLLHHSCPWRQGKETAEGGRDVWEGGVILTQGHCSQVTGWSDENAAEWRLWTWLLLLQKFSSQKDHSFDTSHHTKREFKVYIPFSFGRKWYNQIQTIVCLKDPKELKMGILAFSQVRIQGFINGLFSVACSQLGTWLE